MIKVWTDGVEAGLLDRYRDRGSTFIYLPGRHTSERSLSPCPCGCPLGIPLLACPLFSR